VRTTTLLLLLLLSFSPVVSAKALSANAFCVAMDYFPDFINEEIYEKNTARVIDSRIGKEVEQKGITPQMAIFFRQFVRSYKFKQLLLDQGETWCKRR
jgi:hypothetical protein